MDSGATDWEKSRFGDWVSEIMQPKSLVTARLYWGRREPLKWGADVHRPSF